MAGVFYDTLNAGHNNTLTENLLYGLDGNDNLQSSEATMYAEGGTGNDFIGLVVNVAGTVELYGGEGNDQLFGRQGPLDRLYGGQGDDWLVAAAANLNADGSITPQETSGVDYMEGGAGTDAVYGFDGNDELYGGGGDDKGTANVAQYTTFQDGTLVAIRAGVYGGDGDDLVSGGGGNDRVSGGAGRDTVYGDSGADEFLFDTALNGTTNVDAIKDFSRSEGDKIVLASAVFEGIGTSLAKKEFALGNGAKDGSDHVIYNARSGKLFHDADGKGGEGKTLFAILDKNLALNHTDFSMI